MTRIWTTKTPKRIRMTLRTKKMAVTLASRMLASTPAKMSVGEAVEGAVEGADSQTPRIIVWTSDSEGKKIQSRISRRGTRRKTDTKAKRPP